MFTEDIFDESRTIDKYIKKLEKLVEKNETYKEALKKLKYIKENGLSLEIAEKIMQSIK
jgi:cell shape-determining protein MreC